MKRHCFIGLFMMLSAGVYAQADSAFSHPHNDTVYRGTDLQGVTVRAYESNKGLMQTAAAVNVVNELRLQSTDNSSILQAVNSTPGVRMEERSPGSYRFGIRGSSLESPFGVRNVKVYYNDIPFTGPSGNTCLNQLGFYNIRFVEIIKGPAGSLYGAGTGGALLINSMPQYWQQGASASYIGGSYGLSNSEAEVRLGDSTHRNLISYQHLSGDGYRQQSAITKDVAAYDVSVKHNKGELSAHFLYGNLTYQTPGGLTLKEYNADPQQSRPAAGSNISAEQAKATIYQQMFLAGFTYKQQLSNYWANTTTLYGNYTQMLNPNIRNYSQSTLPDYGGRTGFKYERPVGNTHLQWITGAELEGELAMNKTYTNHAGQPGTLQADQELNSTLAFGFTQVNWQVQHWIFTGGLSVNELQVRLQNFSPYSSMRKNFDNQLAPRIAVLNKLSDNATVYAVAEKGFSPPTIDELAPTGSAVNFNLDAEHGYDYEIGARGYAFNRKLFVDANAFYYTLQGAIVQRRDSAGGDYYLNAGSTEQMGVEIAASYTLLENTNGFAGPIYLDASYTGDYFHYKNFRQIDVDYSGKQLPGVAPNTFTAGVRFYTRIGLYLFANYFFSDRIALDDANDAYANAYHLLGAKLGYKQSFRHVVLDVFAGGNNLLNQKYSLGNDINAAGGRFYNAAAPVNFYGGVTVGYVRR